MTTEEKFAEETSRYRWTRTTRRVFIHERLLKGIVDYGGRRGIELSKPVLAREMCCSRITLDRAVTMLRRKKLIVTEPVILADGKQGPNRYRATRRGRELAARLPIMQKQ